MPRLKVRKPPHRLQEGSLLRKDLDRVRGVDPHAEAVRDPAVERHLVRGGGVEEERLELGPPRRRHEIVAI